MNKIPTAHFTEFIDFFPPLELPFNLLPDLSQIPSGSTPLPGALLEAFIYPFEGDEVDEFTEYVPYGRISGVRDFYAVIYWKAGVMQYEFILASFTKDGNPINHAIVSGLKFDENEVLHSVAVVHEDLTITIAEGVLVEGRKSDLDETNTYQMSIEPDGQITYEVNEEDKEI